MAKSPRVVTRALLLSVLVASACDLMAAERIDLEQAALAKTLVAQGAAAAHELLGVAPAELQTLRSQQYASGKTLTRFNQLYQGVPIFDQAIVRQDDGNDPTATRFSGILLRKLEQDLPSVKPAYSQDQILALAKARVAASGKTENDQARLVIMLDEKNVAKLVYQVSFLSRVPGSQIPSRPSFMIDANNGAILQQWEGLKHLDATGPGGNGRTGKYEYGPVGSGAKFGPLVVTADCKMDGPNVATVNMNHATDATSTPYQFTCPRNDGLAINGAFSPLNDAHFFGNAIFNLYNDWFGIRPISKKLLMRVHYGNNVENAFWDGMTMSFGDGGSTFYPLVSLDIAAHEISHGFTEEHAGLTFGSMPAALNESFSDMAGQAAVWYVYGKGDFTLGRSVFKGTGGPLRYMDDPTKDGHSIGHMRNFSGSLDIHYTSGIFNKAFYVLANKPGWNVRKAFEVMVDANRFYWTSSTTFNAAACGVEKAAAVRGYAAVDVAVAFADVGVSGGCSGVAGVPALAGTAAVTLTKGQQRGWFVTVPDNATSLTIKTSGGSGNLDLYLQSGALPTTTSYLRRSKGSSNAESIVLTKPAAGNYYVMLNGSTAVSGASLVATVVGP
jgi:pseudolysin/vibriolysin